MKRATAILVLAACNAGGSFQLLGGGSSPASASPSAPRSGASTTSPSAAPAGARARVSSARPAVREGGGYEMTDAQRDADPSGDLIYPIAPLGECADPGAITVQSRTPEVVPYPARPADPWHALTSSRGPAALPLPENRMQRASVYARTDNAICDGAHDHCFRDCTWLVRDSRLDGIRTFEAFPAHLRPDGYWSRPASTNRYEVSAGVIGDNFLTDAEAYRTIPATTRLLAPGVWIAVHPSVPSSEREAFEPWRIGKVREIDTAAQTVTLVGAEEVYPLAAARIAVFVSHKNGAIEMLGSWKREQLLVAPTETFVPVKETP